jgi:hypothetical protein
MQGSNRTTGHTEGTAEFPGDCILGDIPDIDCVVNGYWGAEGCLASFILH